MKTSPFLGRISLTLAGFLLLSASLVQVAVGQAAFNFSPAGFTSTNVCANSPTPASGCQVLTNGSAAAIAGGILRLNSANQDQHASAWYYATQPLNTGFTTAFQFTISNTGLCAGCGFPGDGIALVIQGDPA
jgi:hypothetical protein